jgi:hypothetical protein
MQDLPLDTGAVLAMTLEAALWGFSVFIFGLTMYMLCRNRSPSEINKKNVATATVLLILSTMHIIWNVKRVVTAFRHQHGRISGGGATSFLTRVNRDNIILCFTYLLQTMVGDAVLIYRCYTVWQSFSVILVPAVLWCGMAASLAGSLHGVVKASNEYKVLFSIRSTGIWFTSFYSLTLATNLISTGLLAYRIWKVDQEASLWKTGARKSNMFPIMMVIIDAGVLYSAMLAAAIIAFAVKSNAIFIMVDLIVPTISCIFYVILIRIALSQATNRSLALSMSYGTIHGRTTEYVRSQETSPIEVRITRSVTESTKDRMDPIEEVLSIRPRWRPDT